MLFWNQKQFGFQRHILHRPVYPRIEGKDTKIVCFLWFLNIPFMTYTSSGQKSTERCRKLLACKLSSLYRPRLTGTILKLCLYLETTFPKIERFCWECLSQNENHYQKLKIEPQKDIFLQERNLLRHNQCTQFFLLYSEQIFSFLLY